MAVYDGQGLFWHVGPTGKEGKKTPKVHQATLGVYD